MLLLDKKWLFAMVYLRLKSSYLSSPYCSTASVNDVHCSGQLFRYHNLGAINLVGHIYFQEKFEIIKN